MVDQISDWFGKDIAVRKTDDENNVIISLWASPNAMEHWAMQYLNYVEIISPAHLRDRIKESLHSGIQKYAQK
jgi:predicted DNA-binding transcriptional regulator YafY